MTHLMKTRGKTRKSLEEQQEEDTQQNIGEMMRQEGTEASGSSGETDIAQTIETGVETSEEVQSGNEEEEIDLRTFMRAMFKKMDQMDKNVNKKIDKMDKKIDENNKHMKENNASLEKKIEEGYDKVEKKMENVRKELREEMNSMWENVEKEQDRIRNDFLNNLEIERMERTTEMGKYKEEIEVKIQGVKLDVQNNEEQVRNVKQRWQEAIVCYQEYIDGKFGEKENELLKNVDEKIEKEKKKINEAYERVPFIGRCNVAYGNNDQSVKFSGYIKALHPVVFIKSMKNKCKYTTNFDDIKEMIRHNLTDTALVWYTSVEDEIQNFEDFSKKFLDYFWGESAQAEFRETLYFGKFNYRMNYEFVKYALRLFTIAKCLSPCMKEDDIVLTIARHFKHEVLETITVNNIRTMDQLTNYLNRLQRGIKTPWFV